MHYLPLTDHAGHLPSLIVLWVPKCPCCYNVRCNIGSSPAYWMLVKLSCPVS